MFSWPPKAPSSNPESAQASLSDLDMYRDTLRYAAKEIGGVECEETVRVMLNEDGYSTEETIDYLLTTYGNSSVMIHAQAAHDRVENAKNTPPKQKRVTRHIGNSALAVIRHTRKLLQQTT